MKSPVHAEPVGVETIEATAGRFIASTGQGVGKAAPVNIAGIRAVYEDDRLVAYIADLDPEGFVILSPDTDLRPIIGFSESGRFPALDDPENVLLQLVRDDMTARLRNRFIEDPELTRYFESNRELWDVYRSEGLAAATGAGEVLGPLLATTWHQNAPYNRLCPKDPSTGGRSLVGCVAVTAAQILQYWRRPESFRLLPDDAYDASFRSGSIYIPGDAATLEFPSFDALNGGLSTTGFTGDAEDAAWLLFAAGIKFGTR